MNITTLFFRIFKMLLIAFVALLLIAVGVKYQQPLNDWNNTVIKGEKKKTFANLYLNNYLPKSETWQLKDKLGEQTLTTNQYGKKVSLGGLITGVNVEKNLIKAGFNSGVVLHLSNQGDLLDRLDLSPLLEGFILQKSNGGVRAFLWLEDNQVFVYYTATDHTKEDAFEVRIALIDLEKNRVLDNLKIGQFEIHEHFALGGGIDYDKNNNSIVLATGSASGTDDTVAGLKAQDASNLFGKVIRIKLDNNQLGQPKVISKGHRNPQGLTLVNGEIYAVEHGPKGGDELNLITDGGNYGWNHFSYGTKYTKVDDTYNHLDAKYTEPLYYFTPSIGISDVAQCPKVFSDPGYQNCLIISSMRDGSFYLMKFNPNRSAIQSVERVHLGNRIRKIQSSEDAVYLFTDSQSIVKIRYSKL